MDGSLPTVLGRCLGVIVGEFCQASVRFPGVFMYAIWSALPRVKGTNKVMALQRVVRQHAPYATANHRENRHGAATSRTRFTDIGVER